MTNKDVHEALDRAADVVPDRDLTAAAWAEGRRIRARRRSAWLGGASGLVAAVMVGIVVLTGGGPVGGTDPADRSGSGQPDDRADQVDTSVPRWPEAAPQGERVVLAFTDATEWEVSGTLEEWAGGAGELDGMLIRELQPAFRSHFPTVPHTGTEIRFDGQSWQVDDCGLRLEGPGGIVSGRAQVSGEWTVTSAPDGAADCGPLWSRPEQWQAFFASAPRVGRDGDLVILDGWVGSEPPRVEASMAFLHVGSEGRTGERREVSWEDLRDQWVEADPATASQAIGLPVSVDLAPDLDAVLTSSGPGEFQVQSCNRLFVESSWLRISASERVELVTAGMATTLAGCGGPGGEQDRLLQSLLAGGATMARYGDYLYVAGWVPETLDPQAHAEAPPSDPGAEPIYPNTVLPAVERLSSLPQVPSALPADLSPPSGDLPLLSDDPVDRIVLAVYERGDVAVMGTDHRWRQAAADVDPTLLEGRMAAGFPLSIHSVSPAADRLAYVTREEIVVVEATTGRTQSFDTGGEWPSSWSWVSEHEVAFRHTDGDVVIDAVTGERRTIQAHPAWANTGPWVVTGPVEGAPGGIGLQHWAPPGQLTDERALGFRGLLEWWQVTAPGRGAAKIGEVDGVEPLVGPGDEVTVFDLVVAHDETSTSRLLQVNRSDTVDDLVVFPVRWLDRGQLLVHVHGNGTAHLVVWDTENGDIQRLFDYPSGAVTWGLAYGDLRPAG